MKRRLLLYALAAALVAGAAWLTGVAVRGAAQDQPVGEVPQARGDAEDRKARLEARVRDLMDRHPDFELAEARRLLQELQSLAPRARGAGLDALEERLHILEEELRAEALGTGEPMNDGAESRRLKTFSPNGFKQLYERTAYPGLIPMAAIPAVTGDPAADRRIAELAAARGYRLRGEANVEGLEREGGHALQPEAFASWRALQAEARSEGLELGLVSGYRSVDRQRTIFLAALQDAAARRGRGSPSTRELASGQADELLDEVLRESSPPGFSRHHTGYALDITDHGSGRDFTAFGLTQGFAWMSARNYLNAKRFGFIPSYPAGASGQGPDPEPWEYVWVGSEVLARDEPRQRDLEER